MRVCLLHNAVEPDASAADRDVLVQAAAVARAVEYLGHTHEMLACTLDLETARRRLIAARPDVVFNLVESLGGSDGMAIAATALLDALHVPYTGNPTAAIFLTNHKLLAKQRLRQFDLPTPAWLDDAGDDPQPAAAATRPVLRPPYIIKAIAEHASFGLDEHSVISDPDVDPALRLREFAAAIGRPCFAEAYVDGREFNLSVLDGPHGPEVLPPAEIDFSAFPPGKPRVVGYRAKWAEETFEFVNTPRRFDLPTADGPLAARLQDLARECWRRFGLRGYARVDFRVDVAGAPWVLEINTNPCLSPDAGFAAALERAGISFAAAVERMLNRVNAT